MPTLKRDREDMADDGARKRTKISPSPDEIHTTHPIMDLTADETPSKPEADTSLSQDLQTLNILRGEFDNLRQLNTCKICERLMYEPYVISCGHTYCYSCLCTWFATSHKKTCPNCRELITQSPAPSYVIREMIHIFMNRHHLLPDGETIEQHQQWAFEEAEMVRNDKVNGDPKTGGLFKGVFRSRRERMLPNHDPIDHVDRCPQCNWEIEDGMCLQCNIRMDRWSDTDTESSSDMHGESIPDDFEDEDMDADAGHGEFDMDFTPAEYDAWMRTHNILEPGGSDDSETRNEARALRQELLHQMVNRQRHNNRFMNWNHDRVILDEASEDEGSGHSLNEEDEDEINDEDAGSLDGFLDNRDINDITAYTMSSPNADEDTALRNNLRELREIQRQRQRQTATNIGVSSSHSGSGSEYDSDSDGIRHNPHFHRPQAPISIDSDDDEESVAPVRRRPIRILDSEEEEDSDEEEPIPASRRPVPASRRPRPTRIPDDDDEESASETAASANSSPGHSSDGISSDEESEDEQAPRNRTTSSRHHQTHHNRPQNQAPINHLSDSEKSSAYTGERSEDLEIGDDYDSDAVQEGGANFSPISGDEEPQAGMDYFDVYGGEGDEEDDEDEDEDEDHCY